MCCSNAAWKREEVPDHKFDFIDVRDFHATNFSTRLQYGWLYFLILKSGGVYVADIYSGVLLLASNHWSGQILTAAANSGNASATAISVPFSIGKWIFFGCIILSFLLFLWEARKARAIIRSRDISYAFTNVMAQNYYSLKSYDTFCFFSQIDNSKKKKDELSFFVFFTFKSWKRLLLADAPRQVINGLTLYSFGAAEGWTTDVSAYFNGGVSEDIVIVTMLFSVVVWVGSALLLLIAALIYVPLLCYIQGNLKEYCCHKVDKRIEELMKRKTRKRLAKEAAMARKEAKGDFSHLKDKTGKFTRAPLAQPTLPSINLDEDHYAPSTYGSDAGSLYGGRGGQNAYQYPPPNGNGGWQLPAGRQGDFAPPSSLSRTGYPYQTSSDGLSNAGGHGYADSVNSLEGLAANAAPMGYDPRSGRGAPSPLQRGMTNQSYAPSYRSDDDRGQGEKGGYGGPQHGHTMSQSSGITYNAPFGFEPKSMRGPGGGGREGAVSPAPSFAQSFSGMDFGPGLSRQDSLASHTEQDMGYNAPGSRDQLYERTMKGGGGRQSEMTLGSMGDELGRLVNDGGWESSRTEVVAQEYAEQGWQGQPPPTGYPPRYDGGRSDSPGMGRGPGTPTRGYGQEKPAGSVL